MTTEGSRAILSWMERAGPLATLKFAERTATGWSAAQSVVARNDLVIKMNDILVQNVVVIPMVQRTQPTDGKSKQLQGIKANAWDSVLWNLAEWTKTGG